MAAARALRAWAYLAADGEGDGRSADAPDGSGDAFGTPG
jgi:hypothetical protein